jgi:hypothetical protein
LQVIVLVISFLTHGSLVPGSHFLVSRRFPSPQLALRRFRTHLPSSHGPNSFLHSVMQLTFLLVSSELQISIVPSLQLLVWSRFPLPHFLDVSNVLHSSTSFHSPSTLGQSFNLHCRLDILSLNSHFCMAPSLHVLVLICVPGPQFEPNVVGIQSPSNFHFPSTFSGLGVLEIL